jgi:hypothetical protein
MLRTLWLTASLFSLVALAGLDAWAEDPPAAKEGVKDKEQGPADEIPAPDLPSPATDPDQRPEDKPSPDIDGLTRLAKNMDIWIDLKRKIVVVDGRVACREGTLEMFACPKGTKEHESLVAVNAQALFVHAGLLAVGAKPGTPVQFDPKYAAATGPKVEVLILWKDKEGKKQKVRAQEWIKHTKTKKPMEYDWVFAGSGFWVDEDTGEKHYHADSGDLICVSNFPSATLDLPVKSSKDNTDLLFEAFTDKIPEKGTKVRLVLVPTIEAKKDADKK